MINDFKTPELKDAILSLMKVGEDAVSFYHFTNLIQDLDRQSAEGDKKATEILRRVIGVGKLVEFSQPKD